MSLETAVTPESIIGLIMTVSVASERLVEIIKGVLPWLSSPHSDPVKEAHRKAALQLLAVVCGIVTAFLAEPILPPAIGGLHDHKAAVVAIGLLASGGSGFWNAILSYLLQVKDLKKLEVRSVRSTLERPANVGYLEPSFGAEQMTSNECYDVGEK